MCSSDLHNAERQGTTTVRKTTTRTTKTRRIWRMRNAMMGTTTKQLGNGDDRDNGKQDLTRIASTARTGVRKQAQSTIR